MIDYKRFILKNGLTLLTHKDSSTMMTAVNIIYKVGSKNENINQTGFAHLFEHLMFSGSKHVPLFDIPIQKASGENNAFTCSDYTNYYIVLPKENIETALWVESDRMDNLNINQQSLNIQKKVVVEEFNQRYLNKPYGDLWKLLRKLTYKKHPYKWQTIGKNISHIKNASLSDVEDFYNKYYSPSNAIISIAGDFEHEDMFELVDKYFGDIKNRKTFSKILPTEPPIRKERFLEVEKDVPVTVIYIAFHTDGRMSKEFNICDTISDILSNGDSSRMIQNLVKKRALFSSVNAYLTAEIDNGLFVVTGSLNKGVDIKIAQEALWEELEAVKDNKVSDYELQKVKNKFEVNTIFGELNVMNKAMNLGFYELLGDIEYINSELDSYKSVSCEDIQNVARKLFKRHKSATLIYKSKC